MKNVEKLKQALEVLKQSEPGLRQRDRAQKLGISEAELLSLSLGENITLLSGDWKKLIQDVKEMGYVMALTRNESCVHERKGIYDNIEFYEGAHNVGVAVNPDIDLRFFMNEWEYAFAVNIPKGNTVLHSFQFFNKRGEAVHKIFSTPKSDIEAYHRLVKMYEAKDQVFLSDVDHSILEIKADLADAEIDQLGFQQAWRDLQDTHDFFGMLKEYNVSRLQGFRLAPEGYVQKVDNEAVIRLLEDVSEKKVSIMCFVHSKGCVQIHTGPVKNLKVYGDWYNVMDPKFNLHLNMKAVTQSWIVRKPTVDGIVTSLELFDKDGELIVYFFGERKPGNPELKSWRKAIEEIAQASLEQNASY